MSLLTPEDFVDEPLVQDMKTGELQSLIDSAEAIARDLYVPRLHHDSFPRKEGAKALIKKAILYDVENRGKKAQSESAGSFQRTHFQPSRRGTFFSADQVKALLALNVRRGLPGVYTMGVSRREAFY